MAKCSLARTLDKLKAIKTEQIPSLFVKNLTMPEKISLPRYITLQFRYRVNTNQHKRSTHFLNQGFSSLSLAHNLGTWAYLGRSFIFGVNAFKFEVNQFSKNPSVLSGIWGTLKRLRQLNLSLYCDQNSKARFSFQCLYNITLTDRYHLSNSILSFH